MLMQIQEAEGGERILESEDATWFEMSPRICYVYIRPGSPGFGFLPLYFNSFQVSKHVFDFVLFWERLFEELWSC